MIVLDTNVVSELLKPVPETRVLDWVNRQPEASLYLSSVTVAELRAGVAYLAEGARKRALSDALETSLLPLFSGRILNFDFDVTPAFARISRHAKTAGRSMAFADTAIAAIAFHNAFALATRDVSDFECSLVKLINPWQLQVQ